MQRQHQMFLIFCLMLTTGILWAYLSFARHFDSGWEFQREAQALKSQLSESKLEVALLQHQMRDLEQTVAGILPQHGNLAKQWPYSDLVKSLRAPASVPLIDLSSTSLEKGKRFFREGKFETAAKEFEHLIQRYPSSAYQIQARFFLAETYFLQREFRRCVDVIDEMVLQFPDHELTGYILLRLGQISEYNGQIDEAHEIYRTVADHFKDKPLKEQARTLIRSLTIE